jgi:hypothetical protein
VDFSFARWCLRWRNNVNKYAINTLNSQRKLNLLQDEDKLYLCVSSPTIKDKPVQIRPWRLSDADFVLDASLPLDPRKTVFVGGVPRPLKAGQRQNKSVAPFVYRETSSNLDCLKFTYCSTLKKVYSIFGHNKHTGHLSNLLNENNLTTYSSYFNYFHSIN